MMKQAFTSQRQLLVTASCSQKPSDVSKIDVVLRIVIKDEFC